MPKLAWGRAMQAATGSNQQAGRHGAPGLPSVRSLGSLLGRVCILQLLAI